jgi:hypothetical protein
MTMMEEHYFPAGERVRYCASRALDRDDTPIRVNRETLRAGMQPDWSNAWEYEHASETVHYTFDEALAYAEQQAQEEYAEERRRNGDDR